MAFAPHPEARRSSAVAECTGVPGRRAGQHSGDCAVVTNYPEASLNQSGLPSCSHHMWRRGRPRLGMLPPTPFPLQESERPASPVLVSGKEDWPATPWSSKPLTQHGCVTVHGASSQAWWCARPPTKARGRRPWSCASGFRASCVSRQCFQAPGH